MMKQGQHRLCMDCPAYLRFFLVEDDPLLLCAYDDDAGPGPAVFDLPPVPFIVRRSVDDPLLLYACDDDAGPGPAVLGLTPSVVAPADLGFFLCEEGPAVFCVCDDEAGPGLAVLCLLPDSVVAPDLGFTLLKVDPLLLCANIDEAGPGLVVLVLPPPVEDPANASLLYIQPDASSLGGSGAYGPRGSYIFRRAFCTAAWVEVFTVASGDAVRLGCSKTPYQSVKQPLRHQLHSLSDLSYTASQISATQPLRLQLHSLTDFSFTVSYSSVRCVIPYEDGSVATQIGLDNTVIKDADAASIGSSRDPSFSSETGRHSSSLGNQPSVKTSSVSCTRAPDIRNIWGVRMALEPALSLNKDPINESLSNTELSILKARADLLAPHSRESNVCKPAMKVTPTEELYQGFDCSGLSRELKALQCAKKRRRFTWLSVYHRYSVHLEDMQKMDHLDIKRVRMEHFGVKRVKMEHFMMEPGGVGKLR
eukprot:gene4495-14654_t